MRIGCIRQSYDHGNCIKQFGKAAGNVDGSHGHSAVDVPLGRRSHRLMRVTSSWNRLMSSVQQVCSKIL